MTSRPYRWRILAGTLVWRHTALGVTVTDGLTLNNGSIDLAADSSLTFQGTQSLMGNGSVTFSGGVNDASAWWSPGPGDTLTLTPGILVHGTNGFVGSNPGGCSSTRGPSRPTVAAP